MVAIVTGSNLGLFNASSSVLGASGNWGSGSVLGQFGGRGYVNAVTGNLVLQGMDEGLSGRGADLMHLRTYNSRGLLTDGDGDNWRWDAERALVLSGTRNADGSTVTRMAGDGSQTVYSWNGTKYSSTDGDGAHDTIEFKGDAGAEWLFIDGSSRREERYSGAATVADPARLVSQKDLSGNVMSFGYTSGRLTSIVDNSKVDGSGTGSGQKIVLTYGVVPGSNPALTRLLKVETFSLTVDGSGRAAGTLGAAVRQVEYGYDANGRLTSVTSDLTPGNTADNATTPGTLYKTKYTYAVANSGDTRIASVMQSDGTATGFAYAQFTYEPVPGVANQFRIKTVTDGAGVQTFTYNNGSTDVKISDDAAGQVNARTWTYTYDATSKQLTKVESPPPVSGGARLVTRYEYDGSGNVTKVIDARGNAMECRYDARGNCIIERDGKGNTVTRLFGATNNQLITETRYRDVDPDAIAAGASPVDALTTRYVYDGAARLRFVITAEGRVTEHRYGTGTADGGLLVSTLRYAANRYDLSGLSTTQAPTESQLTAWLSSTTTPIDKKQVEQVKYEYDLRGNLAKRTDFATSAADGTGVLDAAASVTEYIYDGHGALLQTIAVRGSGRDQKSVLTSLSYDGLGRLTKSVSANGERTTVYDDVNRRITVETTATGLQVLSGYDAAGRLVSVSQSAGGVSRPQTVYQYDAQGRLRLAQDGQGGRRFSFYDDAGRLLFVTDTTGAVTGHEYNANGQLTKQIRYSTRADMTGWVNDAGVVTKAALTVGGAGSDILTGVDDRVTRYEYDAAGRLEKRIDALAVETRTTYDGLSQIARQETGERITRYFYDGDGLQVGVVDPLGYLTENKYDAAGRLVETVRYSTRSPSAQNASGPVWVGATDRTVAGGGRFEYQFSAVGGRAFEYRLPAVDADGGSLTFEPVGSLPDWLVLQTDSGGATLRGTPPKTVTSYDIELKVSDGRATAKTAEAKVHITVANSPPSWRELEDRTVPAKTAGFSLTLPEASDIESAAGALIYSIVSALPPGLSFDAGKRILSGTPATPGSYTITARVADGSGPDALITERSFVLQVTNNRPVWQPISNPNQFKNTQFTFKVPPASDLEGQARTYKAIKLPSWLTFNPATLELSGKPPALGLEDVVLEATDTFGDTQILSFSFRIVNRAPSWVTLSSPPWKAGSAVDYQPPAAVDPDGEAIVYADVSHLHAGKTGLPPGLSVSSATGRITGTSNRVGTFEVMLRATDANGSFIERPLTLVLENAEPVYVHGINDVSVAGGADVFIVVPADAFIDPNGDPLSPMFAITPAWLSFNSAARTFSGRAPNETRLWGVSVIVSDFTNGGTAVRNFKISVTYTPPPPPPGGGGAPPPGGGGPGGGPPQQQQSMPGGGLPIAPATPIAAAPAPVLVPIEAAPQPRMTQALAPLVDVLSAWRPASNEKDLHSYQYYDAQGRVVGTVDERGFLTELVYNAQTNKDEIRRYEDHLTVSSTEKLEDLRGRAGAVLTSTTEYDSLGRVLKRTDIHGTVTRNEYDGAGRLMRVVRADGTSEARASRTRYNGFDEVTGTLGGEGEAWLVADQARTLDSAINTFGTRHEYDSLGRGVKTLDANGNATRLYYDGEGRLTHTLNAAGEVSETKYTLFGQVESTVRYGTRVGADLLQGLINGAKKLADLQAALAAMPSQLNAQTKYQYDRRGLTTKVTDAQGFDTDNAYNAFGELATQVRTILQAAARTTRTQFDYDLRGALLSTTRDLGGLNANTQAAYDAFGRVIRSLDAAGKATTTDYRDSGRKIEISQSVTGQTRTTSTRYDAFARAVEQIDAAGKVTRYEYHEATATAPAGVSMTTPEGVTVRTNQTRHGETLSIVDGRNNASTYEYNKDGQLLKVIDALGKPVTDNKYHESGRLLETRDARGVVTTFKYDVVNRVLERRVDPAGLNLVTTYEFSAFGEQKKVTEGVGSNTGANITRVTSYEYDRNGRLSKVIAAPDTLKLTTTFQYDGLGNTIQVDRGAPGNLQQQVTLYEFDQLGRRTREIAAPSSVFGAGSARERNLTTEYRYDTAGRLSRKIDALGQSTWYVYSEAGELTHVVNAEGEVSRSFYDITGRLVRTHRHAVRLSASTLASLGDVASASVVTPAVDDSADQRSAFVHDNDGRLCYTLTNFFSDKWLISESRYDNNGNLLETRRYDKSLANARIVVMTSDEQVLDPITVEEVAQELRTTLLYDDTKAGTLAKIQRTRFAYDANNRLRFTIDALGSVSENVYDSAGNVIGATRYAARPTLTGANPTESEINAAVTRSDAANQVSRFVYDGAGRQLYSARVSGFNGSGQALHAVSKQVHDAVGRVVQTFAFATEMTLADYERATLDTAVNANKSTQDRRNAFAYDDAGRQIYSVRIAAIDESGVATRHLVSKREYDDLGQVIKNTAYAAAITATLSDYAKATLDTAVTAIASSKHDRTTAFVYDNAGRQRFVVAADGSLSETMYDAAGQVTERRQFDFLVSASTPRTEAALAARRANRAVGDTQTRGEKYTYDHAGRMKSDTDAVNAVEAYTYDAFGNRKTFTNRNGDTWTYTYDRVGQRRTEVSPAVAVKLSEKKKQADPDVVVMGLTTAMDYDAFGNVTSRTEASGTVDARVTKYGYDAVGRLELTTMPGHYDPATGKVEKTAATGRFERTRQTIYDALGNAVQTKLRKAAGTAASSFLNEYKTYDTLGRVLHDVDALSQVSGYKYNVFGEQESVTRFSVVVSGAPANAKFWLSGEIAGKVGGDAAARTITMKYDNLGYKTEVKQPQLSRYYSSTAAGVTKDSIAPANPAPAPTTKYEYTAFGEVRRESVQVDMSRWRDTWHYFDLRGRETRTIDTLGYHTAREYDAAGNLLETVELATAGSPGGSNLEPPSKPAVSKNDRITVFKYDALNQNTSIERKNLRYTAWNGTQYVQSDGGNSVKTVATMTYDGTGRVLTQTDALGNLTKTEYNKLGQVTKVTEPERFMAGERLDPFLNQVELSPVITMTLNAFGQVVTQVRSAGGGSGATLTTEQSYDAAGNAISSKDANGNVKDRQYDFAGRVSKETQKIEMTLGNWRTPAGSAGSWQTINHTLERRYAYDDSGRQTHTLDVFHDGTTLKQSGSRSVFNAFGEVTAERRVSGAASAALASLSEITVASYAFDKGGRLITREAANGRTEYFYDLTGNVTRQEQRDNDQSAGHESVEPPRIGETSYDTLGRATVRRLDSFSAIIGNDIVVDQVAYRITPVIEQEYDRWGNVTRRIQGRFFDDTTPGVNSTEQRVTQYEYNHDNKVILEKLGQVEAVRANGTSYQAKLFHGLRYDLLGRVVQEFDAADDLGTVVDEALDPLRTRSKEYNDAGQLTAEVDATRHRTEYAYDAHGNRVGTKNADNIVFVDAFDRNGNLVSHGVLHVGEFAYRSGTSHANPTVRKISEYQYDQANRRVASVEKTDMFIYDTPVDVWTFAKYDERGYVRATFKIRALPFASGVVTSDPGLQLSACTYDDFGHKVGETDVLGNVRTWKYNTAAGLNYDFGQLQETTTGGRTTAYKYNDLGQLQKEIYSGAGISAGSVTDRLYEYHDNGLLRKLTDHSFYGTQGMAGGADYLLSTDITAYDYTVNGERAREAFSRTGTAEAGMYNFNDQTGEFDLFAVTQPLASPTITRTTKTTYDLLGRMKEAATLANSNRTALDSLRYRYDELGNRRNIEARYTQPGQAQGRSDKWYSYDDEGRVTTVDGELDEERGEITIFGGGTRVTYDMLGRRETAEKFVGGITFTGQPPAPGQRQDRVHYHPDLDPNQTISGDEYHRERYSYNYLNYLSRVDQQANFRDVTDRRGADPATSLEDEEGSWVISATRGSDLQGNILGTAQYSNVKLSPTGNQTAPVLLRTADLSYDARGFQHFQQTFHWNSDGSKQSTSQVLNSFNDAGQLQTYSFRVLESDGSLDYENIYKYTYSDEFGGQKEARIEVTSTREDTGRGRTENQYDARGNLIRQTLTENQGTRTRLLSYNAEGQITSKDERFQKSNGDAVQSERGSADYFYIAGHQIGTVGSGKLAGATQFSSGFTPISEAYPASSPGSYTVNAQDSLASIALGIFGDASLWYLIADANALSFGPGDTLPSTEVGKTYRIPNVVTGTHNNANTFAPYNPARIIGDSTPTPSIPIPPAVQCSDKVTRVLTIALVVAAGAVVTAYTGGVASALFGQGLLATAMSAGVSAAAGSAVSQLGVIAATGGSLDDFSGFQMLESGLTASFSVGANVGLAALAKSGNLYGTVASNAGKYLAGEAASQLLGRETASFGAALTRIGINSLLDVSVVGNTQDAGVNAALNSTAPSWTGMFAQIAYNALNPDNGWFSNRSGDWANIASSVLNPLVGESGSRLGGSLARSTIEAFKEDRRGAASALSPRAQAALAGGMQLPGGPLSGAEFLAARKDLDVVASSQWNGQIPSDLLPDREPMLMHARFLDGGDFMIAPPPATDQVERSAEHPRGIATTNLTKPWLIANPPADSILHQYYQYYGDLGGMQQAQDDLDQARIIVLDDGATWIRVDGTYVPAEQIFVNPGTTAKAAAPSVLERYRLWWDEAAANFGAYNGSLNSYFDPDEFSQVEKLVRTGMKTSQVHAPGRSALVTQQYKEQIDAIEHARYVAETAQRIGTMKNQGILALAARGATETIAKIAGADERDAYRYGDIAAAAGELGSALVPKFTARNMGTVGSGDAVQPANSLLNRTSEPAGSLGSEQVEGAPRGQSILPKGVRSNVVQVGADYNFRYATNAGQVRIAAENAVKNGATEINILSNAHGHLDYLDRGGFTISHKEAGSYIDNPANQVWRSFFSEDAKTQGILQARYPNLSVNLFDATDPAEFAAYEAKVVQARAEENNIATIGGLCYSCGLRIGEPYFGKK